MKIARFWMLWAGLLCLALTPCVLANDVVTLNSGEVITGTITSQNATQLVIEVSNASRTIFHSRSVPKSEIKANQSETAAEKQERLAYESVQKYQLNPDQELTVAQYDAGLTACQKYLESYSASDYAALVRQRSGQMQQEKDQVGNGLVKLAGHWMIPVQKIAEQDLRKSYRKLQQAQQVVDSLKEQEAEFLRKYRELEDRQTELGTLESRRGYDSTTKFLREQLSKDHTDLRRKKEDFYKTSAWNEAPPYLRLAKKEYATAKAKRDSLMASSPPPQKPAPATQAATTTPPVPPERTKEETPTTPTEPVTASEPAIPPGVRSFSLTGSPAAVVEPPYPIHSNTPVPTPENVPWWESLLAVIIVVTLLTALVWILRRAYKSRAISLQPQPRPIRVAVPSAAVAPPKIAPEKVVGERLQPKQNTGNTLRQILKWVVIGWSLLCLGGCAVCGFGGMANVASSTQGRIMGDAEALGVTFGMGFILVFWFFLWAIVALPSMVIWLVTSKRSQEA